MGNKTKAFKKFASSGKLKDTIKTRRSQQQARRKFEEKVAQRQHQRGAAKDEFGDDEDGEDDDGDEADARDAKRLGAGSGGRAAGVAKTVDELFAGGLEDGEDAASDLDELDEEDEEDGEEEDDDEDEEEALVREEAEMERAMKEMTKKDPEFFKYLKENDPSLLSFGADTKGKKRAVQQASDEDEDEEMDGDEDDDHEDLDEEMMDEDEAEEPVRRKTSVTMKMIRQWQEGMIKQQSIRSLRKTLLAFRAAAHMNEEDASEGAGSETRYSIDSPKVFNKLVVTALKFAPVVIGHHIPVKTLPNGRFKVTQPKKPNPTLNRLILSHFSTVLHFIKSLPSTPSSVSSSTDEDAGGLLLMAINESTRLLPWIMSARKHFRAYLKVLLDLWSQGSDSVRIAAFLAVRKIFVAGDESTQDLCLKNIYKSLLPPLRNTTPHTLPSLNLLKNTAAELFLLNPEQAYGHAFTSIRMLAVHLRSVVRGATSVSTKANVEKTNAQDAFRAVYNWQFVHCIDFWTQVLAGGCDVQAERANGGKESPLRPLIYPLVQIAVGVVRLLPSSRYFPLRFHILHSLIRLIQRTKTYIPLSPFLLEILDSAEFRRSNPKKSTLKPLDFEYIVRAGASYSRTRVFQEGLGEELVYLLGEYHSTISTSIAFPEMTLPVIVTIKRHLKRGTAGSPKVQNLLKTLVEKLEANRTFIETKRRNVGFSPRDRSEIGRFEDGIKPESTPVGSWMNMQRKVRDRKRKEVEKSFREARNRGVQADSDDE